MDKIKRFSRYLVCSISLIYLGCSFEISASNPSGNIKPKKPKVLFINPDMAHESTFWNESSELLKIAAKDLGVELIVHHWPKEALNRFDVSNVYQKAVELYEPDMAISFLTRGTVYQQLSLFDAKRVNHISINAQISKQESYLTAMPREKFKYWLGQITPDDYYAGHLLATALIQQAMNKKEHNDINIIAINGSESISHVAKNRMKGLLAAANQYKDVKVIRHVFTGWSADLAYQKALKIFSLYPKESDIFWAASGTIALNGIKAMNSLNVPSEHRPLIGDIDWANSSLNMISRGEISASVGGHFIEATIALILLYDYHHGLDFVNELGVEIRTQMELITKDNIHNYPRDIMSFERINFQKLSKQHNPLLGHYELNISNIMEQATGTLLGQSGH